MILDVPGSANSVQMNNILGFKIIMVDHLWSLHIYNMCVYNCIIYTTTCGIMQYRGPLRVRCSLSCFSPSTHGRHAQHRELTPAKALRWHGHCQMCVWGDGQEYMGVINDSVNQCERNHPHINASKTKGDGDQPPVEDTTDHSGEHPGFGHTDGGKIQIPGYST